MIKSGKRILTKRRFSEDFKLKIIKKYESGRHSVGKLDKLYDISSQTVYNWIYKYPKYNKRSIKVVELKSSQMNK